MSDKLNGSEITDESGFTLIELLIVIAIIGILALVATSAYIGTMKKAARSEAYSNLQSIRLLEEQYFAENAAYDQNAVCLNTTNRSDGTCFTPATVLQGFKPGGGRNFNYAITQNVALTVPVAVPFGGATVAQTPCFVATATGVPGSRVCPNAANCDSFAIDCNNNRNF